MSSYRQSLWNAILEITKEDELQLYVVGEDNIYKSTDLLTNLSVAHITLPIIDLAT